ncbi:MAG: hypothetical protein ACLVIP_02825 [Ruminococcus sp.]
MDENEITTVADTQAENTADTADTGQTTPTTEELIQQLTARVAALEEIVGEEEYELRYSGEQTDELLDGGTAVFRAKTAAQIVSLVNRLYPLYMRWGSFTVNMKVNADNGSQWSYNTRTGMIPSGSLTLRCLWCVTGAKSTSSRRVFNTKSQATAGTSTGRHTLNTPQTRAAHTLSRCTIS